MARSSAGRPRAGKPDPDAVSPDPTDEPSAELGVDSNPDDSASDDSDLVDSDLDGSDLNEDLDVDEDDDEDDGDAEGDIIRSRQADAFWTKFKVDPVEIALPGGVGYTLRTYRMNTEVKPTDYTAREEDQFPDRSAAYAADIDDEFPDDDLDDELDEDDLDEDELDEDADLDEDDLESAEDDEDEDEEVQEEIPLFLSQSGHLLLFRTRGGLVDFLGSDAEHDMTQLKSWSKFVDQIRPEYVVPEADDTYELDLIVKNLRSGHDTWDPELIVQSGQIARDIGHALHVEPIVMAMAPGSPLDDLDEALRAVAAGGVGTFFARRKAKKIGSETAAIGWRTVIGKISAVVDWRD